MTDEEAFQARIRWVPTDSPPRPEPPYYENKSFIELDGKKVGWVSIDIDNRIKVSQNVLDMAEGVFANVNPTFSNQLQARRFVVDIVREYAKTQPIRSLKT